MEDCLFCKIADGKIPSDIVYQDDRVVAFKDINPQAPVHVVIIPRKHIPNILDVCEDDRELVGHIHLVANKIALDTGVAGDGFRIAVNSGPGAGQSVNHIHFHLLGGRRLGWPPG